MHSKLKYKDPTKNIKANNTANFQITSNGSLHMLGNQVQ